MPHPSSRPATGRTQKTAAAQIAPEVARLHADGLGRNQIASKLGRAPSTVTAAARIAGVSFDTEPSAVATRARHAAAAEKRAHLSDTTAAIAVAAARRLHIEVDASVLDPPAVKALSMALGVAVDKTIALSELQPLSAELDPAAEFIDAYAAAIREVAENIDGDSPVHDLILAQPDTEGTEHDNP